MDNIPEFQKILSNLQNVLSGVSTSTKITLTDLYLLTGQLDKARQALIASHVPFDQLITNIDRSVISLNQQLALWGKIPTTITNVETSWKRMVSNFEQFVKKPIDFTEATKVLDELSNNVYENADKLRQKVPEILQDINQQIANLSKNSYLLQSALGTKEYRNYIQQLLKMKSILTSTQEKLGTDLMSLDNYEVLNLIKQFSTLSKSVSDSLDITKLQTYVKTLKKVDMNNAKVNVTMQLFSTASENLQKRFKTLPGIFGKLGASFSQSVSNMGKTITDVSTFRPKMALAFSSLSDFLKSFTLKSFAVPMVMKGIEELIKLIIHGMNLTTKMTQEFGDAALTLTDREQALRDITHSSFSSALALKNTNEIFKLISTTIKNELYPTSMFANNMLQTNARNIALFSEHIDTFAKGIGTTSDDMMKNLLRIASTLNISLTNLGSQTAQQLTNSFAQFNIAARRGLGLSFDAVMDMGKNVFEGISFLGKDASGKTTRALVSMMTLFRKNIEVTNKHISWTMQQMRTVYQSIFEGINKSSWDLYYGVLAMRGKLTNNLSADLERVFSASPVERFVEIIATMKEIGRGAGVWEVWPALMDIIGQIPDQLVVPITKALNNIDAATLRKLAEKPEEFWDKLLTSQGVSPDEIVKLQRTTSALEDPLQVISTFIKKIYDLLASLTTPVSLGWFKK